MWGSNGGFVGGVHSSGFQMAFDEISLKVFILFADLGCSIYINHCIYINFPVFFSDSFVSCAEVWLSFQIIYV